MNSNQNAPNDEISKYKKTPKKLCYTASFSRSRFPNNASQHEVASSSMRTPPISTNHFLDTERYLGINSPTTSNKLIQRAILHCWYNNNERHHDQSPLFPRGIFESFHADTKASQYQSLKSHVNESLTHPMNFGDPDRTCEPCLEHVLTVPSERSR